MRRALLLVTLFGACHHNPPHKPGEEYLKSVKFEGNHDIHDKALLNGLVLHRTEKAGRPADPYSIQNDADRLRGQYARLGYFETDIEPRNERVKDASTVTFKIEEGKRSLTKVTISGLPKDPAVIPDKVRALLPLEDGQPFDYDVYDQAKVKLLGIVQDAGYAHAKLDATVWGDLATHTANIALVYTPGPKCKFGKVSVQGVDGPLKDAIEDRLKFASGEVYSNAAIAATQRNIYGLARFSTVEVGPDGGQEDKDVLDMHIAVSEGAPRQVTLGGGIGIEPLDYEVRLRAGYQVQGFPTPMDTLTLDFRPAYAYLRDGSGYEPRIRADAKLERQDLWMTYAVGSFDVGYDYLAYEAYTFTGPRAQLGYEFRLGAPWLKGRLGYAIHRYTFSHESDLLGDDLQMQIGIDQPELVGMYQGSLILDLRDHPVEPRWGFYSELKLSEGTKAAGGDYEFQKLEPEVRAYVPAGPIELAARVRYGAIWGDVPPTERFYAGGASSNRGFSERELSPSVTGDSKLAGRTITVPYGGAGLFDSSVEARIPIMDIKSMPLHGVLFLDSSDVTESANPELAGLYYSVGVGARLLTIIGPVRVDFGYRLNKTGPMDAAPDSRYAFHLSLGEAF